MSVTNTTVRQLYEGDGANKTFAIPFDYDGTSEHVKVVLRDNSVDPATETDQVDGVDYNIVSTNVVMDVAPADNALDVGEQLLIIREVPYTQPTELADTTPTPVETLEAMVDNAIRQTQQLKDLLTKIVTVPETSEIVGLELVPDPDLFLKWNSTGTAIIAEEIDLSSLSSSINSNASSISTLAVRVTQNESDISDLEDGEATQDLAIASNASNISANGVSIANLVIQADANTANIATNLASINALNAFLGTQGSQTILNNQAVAVDLTDLTFDGYVYSSILIYYEITRHTDTEDRVSVGTIHAVVRSTGVWETERGEHVIDLDGATISITTGAGRVCQIKYTTDNMVGTSYAGKIKYRIVKFQQ